MQGTGERNGTPAQVRGSQRQIPGRAETKLVPCRHAPHPEAVMYLHTLRSEAQGGIDFATLLRRIVPVQRTWPSATIYARFTPSPNCDPGPL